MLRLAPRYFSTANWPSIWAPGPEWEGPRPSGTAPARSAPHCVCREVGFYVHRDRLKQKGLPDSGSLRQALAWTLPVKGPGRWRVK
jgi:hypothetical protein